MVSRRDHRDSCEPLKRRSAGLSTTDCMGCSSGSPSECHNTFHPFDLTGESLRGLAVAPDPCWPKMALLLDLPKSADRSFREPFSTKKMRCGALTVPLAPPAADICWQGGLPESRRPVRYFGDRESSRPRSPRSPHLTLPLVFDSESGTTA